MREPEKLHSKRQQGERFGALLVCCLALGKGKTHPLLFVKGEHNVSVDMRFVKMTSTAGVRTYGEGGNIRTPCRPPKVHFDNKIRKNMMTKVFIWLT